MFDLTMKTNVLGLIASKFLQISFYHILASKIALNLDHYD